MAAQGSLGNSWAQLWRRARWPSRALFLALSGLFLVRAVYEPNSLCDVAGYVRMGSEALDRRLLTDTFVNTYPPPFAAAMTPVALLSRLAGKRVVRHLWGFAQLAALVYLTRAFARALRLRLTLGAIALAWLSVWGHVVDDLNNQNVSLFLWALVAWASLQASQGRAGLAGAALAIGGTLKVMPAFSLATVVGPGVERRWHLAAGAALGALLSAAVTLIVLGPTLAGEAWGFWWTRILPTAGLDLGPGNRGWMGLALRLWGHSPEGVRLARLIGLGVGLAVLAGVGALVSWRPAPSARGVALDGVLVSIVGVLALPISWSHYLTICIPLALAVWASLGGLPGRSRRAAALLLASGSALACFFNVDLVGRRVWQVVGHYGSTLWGTLSMVAAGLVLREAWRQQDAASAGSVDADGTR